MTKYNYPRDWRRWSPLRRDDWHRHMGALVRRVRFLEATSALVLPARYQRLYWGADGLWHERGR